MCLLPTSGALRALFLILLFTVSSVFGQDKDWRPVSPDDLQSKTPVVEPDADAEAIFWETRIDDSSDDLSLRHYVRVKIFTERGRERYSKFDVPYTRGLKIKELAARVIRPDGTIVEIGKQDIFDREIIKAGGVKVKAKSFAVPNIEPGVIVEYKYKETYDDAGASGMRLQFQRDIPVRSLSYYYKPYNSKEPHYQGYNLTDTKFVKDQGGYWLARRNNVPSFKEEPRMPPEDSVKPWMLLTGVGIALTDVSDFSISFVVKDQTNPKLYWGGVSAQKAGLIKFMNKPSGDIKKAATDITAGATTSDEKLRKLYEFCQKEIKNTTFDTTLTDEDRKKLPETRSMSDVLKRRSGSSQFIDMLFGALASAAGFDSRVAFSGDRSKMFFTPEMANEKLIHPAAIAVKVGEDYKFFNPGVPFLPYGSLVWYEEDSWALIVGEKDYAWRKTPLSPYAASSENRSGKFRLLDDGTLDGEVQIEYLGQSAISYRLDNYDETPDKRVENLKKEIKDRISTAEIVDASIENISDITKPLVKKFRVHIPGYAQRTGKRLFLQPGFFEYGVNPIFSSAVRKYDIFFRYPWSETDTISFELPNGFTLDNADAPGNIADPLEIGLIDISMALDRSNNVLKYNRKFHFGGRDNIFFPSASYQPVKQLFDAFQKADSHTITLKQKETGN
jgi:hypothetical protein